MTREQLRGRVREFGVDRVRARAHITMRAATLNGVAVDATLELPMETRSLEVFDVGRRVTFMPSFGPMDYDIVDSMGRTFRPDKIESTTTGESYGEALGVTPSRPSEELMREAFAAGAKLGLQVGFFEKTDGFWYLELVGKRGKTLHRKELGRSWSETIAAAGLRGSLGL